MVTEFSDARLAASKPPRSAGIQPLRAAGLIRIKRWPEPALRKSAAIRYAWRVDTGDVANAASVRIGTPTIKEKVQ